MKKFLASIALTGALMSGTAMAADLSIAPAAFVWSGPYLGLNAGLGQTTWNNWTEYDGRSNPLDTSGNRKSVNGSSLIGGAQLGYNWQSANFVYGLEGDFQFSGTQSNEQGGWTFDSCGCFNVSMNDFGTLRARAGVTTSRSTMLYLTGGAIVGNLNYSYSDRGSVGSANVTGVGLVVGAGAETKVSEKISIKLEGLYYDFGSPRFTVGDTTFDTNINVHGFIGRAGLNFHF